MESYEAEEIGRYTSLSSLAVCAALLGIASLVALLAPLMLVVPLAGIIVSTFAIHRINRSEGALSGRNLALIGLALSVACAVASPLRVKVRDGMYAQQAKEVAHAWLMLVADNQLQAALEQASGNAKSGLMGPPPADGPRPKMEPHVLAANLGNTDLVTHLREEAEHGELEFAARNVVVDAQAANPRVAITFQTVKPDDSLTMNIVLLRSHSGGNWYIDRWALEGEGEHSHDHAH